MDPLFKLSAYLRNALFLPIAIGIGLDGNSALAFAEALAQAGIEYRVERVCLPMPKRLRAGRRGPAALELSTKQNSSHRFHFES